MSDMQLWHVRAADSDDVTVVASRTKLAARMRVAEERGRPLRVFTAELEPDAGGVRRRHFRCGEVALQVMWSDRACEWFVGATYAGERRYVTIGRPPASKLAVDSREAMRDAARAAVAFLLDADDLDESMTVWAQRGTEAQLHVVEDVEGG